MEDELAYGVVAVAVPVFDQSGRVVAALNSSSHSRRTSKASLVRQRLSMLRKASKEISVELAPRAGHRAQRADLSIAVSRACRLTLRVRARSLIAKSFSVFEIPMNAADRTSRVPGARLRYRDEGAGHAVVFVHGWTLDLEMWEPQAPLAAPATRVIRLRPAWLRPVYRDCPSLADDVDDLHALLVSSSDSLSRLLVGMSQGARVVLEFAARYPGRCARHRAGWRTARFGR